jgi:hypothetical protein
MLQSREFQIVFVDKNHGVGIGPEQNPDRIVKYSGAEIRTHFRDGIR